MVAEIPTLREIAGSLDASREKEIQQCIQHLEMAIETQENANKVCLNCVLFCPVSLNSITNLPKSQSV